MKKGGGCGPGLKTNARSKVPASDVRDVPGSIPGLASKYAAGRAKRSLGVVYTLPEWPPNRNQPGHRRIAETSNTMQSGSIERCQICGVTLARRGSDGFTCDHCLDKTMRHFGLKRAPEDKALRGPRHNKAAR